MRWRFIAIRHAASGFCNVNTTTTASRPRRAVTLAATAVAEHAFAHPALLHHFRLTPAATSHSPLDGTGYTRHCVCCVGITLLRAPARRTPRRHRLLSQFPNVTTPTHLPQTHREDVHALPLATADIRHSHYAWAVSTRRLRLHGAVLGASPHYAHLLHFVRLRFATLVPFSW